MLRGYVSEYLSYRDNSCTTSDRFVRILDFRHFERQMLFSQSDRKTYKKAWPQQFTSELYKEITEEMKRSYSKKACPWDNACIESFHSLIKREWLNQYKIQNYEDAYKLIFEYIETFYNTVRIHSHCNYESPNQYEKSYVKSNWISKEISVWLVLFLDVVPFCFYRRRNTCWHKPQS